MIRQSSTQSASYTATSPFTTWTIRETAIATGRVNPKAADISPSGLVRIFFGGSTNEDVYYFDTATDTTDASWANKTSVGDYCTALHVESGTLGSTYDLVFGTILGTIETWDAALKAKQDNLFTGQVNGIEYSSVSARWIAVGANAEIYTCAGGSIQSAAWNQVTNPFTAAINHVAYNVIDDIFVAVSADGKIARSVDGISAIAGSPA